MLALSLIGGALLGAMFFGGLWWTLRSALSARRAALWIMLSSQLRSVTVVAGFYCIGRGDWHRLVAAIAGFVITRSIVMLWPHAASGAPIPVQSVPLGNTRRDSSRSWI